MATNSEENNRSINAILGDEIGQRRNELEQLWFDHLRTTWGSVSESRLSILQQPNQVSLLDVALRALSGREQIGHQDVESFVNRVRLRKYSISDVFNEFLCLEDALREFLPAVGIKTPELSILFDRFKKSFCTLFGAVLRETSEFYEHVIERGNTGFCQTDTDGRVVYANQEIKRIFGGNDLIGKPLKKFFDGYESDLVQTLLSADQMESVIQAMNFRSASGNLVPVGVELARVCIGGKPVGAYAHVTDISRPTQLQNDVFDRLMLGIIRVNADWRITFMNKSLREMLDITGDNWLNRPIEWLFPDDENRRIVKRKLYERFSQGKSDEYEARFRRMDGRSIPVKITAAPEKTPSGKVLRTIGVVRSMVRERIHEHIEREREPQKLMQAVMEEIQSAVPFHRVYVVLYSQDEKHVRSFFVYSMDGTPVMQRRWWKMSPAMLAWARLKEIFPIADLKAFYEQPDFIVLKSDPAIQEILNNFSSSIYYPVVREGKVVACTVFYSKALNRYGEKDRLILHNLPLASSILMAIHYEEKKNLEFLLNLTKEISRAGDDMEKIAHILVNSVASHYDWKNVALFNARKAQRHFHLLSQHTLAEFHIPEGYTQPIDVGVLGLVYKTKVPVNIDDVRKGEYRNIFKPTIEKVRSELCIPIESGELFWLLNIEDPLESAFSKDEELALVRLIDEVRVFLERSWLRKFLDESLLSTSDAVWVTDSQGRINRSNPAAQNLLQYSEDELVEFDLADILRDREMAKRLTDTNKKPNVKISLRTKDGKFVNVLLSKFKLQEYFQTNVYIAKDLSAQERLEELEYLGKMYYEIATQTKTPLTLIFGWLERFGRQTEDEKTKEIVDRSLRQLRKIELTYDRLSFYDKQKISEIDFPHQKILCSFQEIWKIVEGDFPQNELDRIEIHLSCIDPLISGDLFQLSFCFETILSYLMRFLPQDQKIHVHVGTSQGWLEMKIEAVVPGLKNKSGELKVRTKIERTLVQMALGEEILSEFIIKKHEGSYSGAKWSGDRIEFFITLPLAEELKK